MDECKCCWSIATLKSELGGLVTPCSHFLNSSPSYSLILQLQRPLEPMLPVFTCVQRGNWFKPPEVLFSPFQFNLSSFSVRLSVKFTSVVEKRPPIGPRTSTGSRRVRISCPAAWASRAERKRSVGMREHGETPGEHECLCNPVLNKNLGAFLLHAPLFLVETRRRLRLHRCSPLNLGECFCYPVGGQNQAAKLSPLASSACFVFVLPPSRRTSVRDKYVFPACATCTAACVIIHALCFSVFAAFVPREKGHADV